MSDRATTREALRLHTLLDSGLVAIEYLAALLLLHRRLDFSWAEFLERAGRFTDAANRGWACEEFFSRLTAAQNARFPSHPPALRGAAPRERPAGARDHFAFASAW